MARRTVSEHHAQLLLETQGYEAGMNRVVAVTNRAEQAQASSARNSARVAQQAGFQVQDFFVQVASGQSKLVALAQQLPQFLGVFGPAGALAGAAFAMGAVGLQIFNAARGAKNLKEQAKEAKEEARRLEEALEKVASAYSRVTASAGGVAKGIFDTLTVDQQIEQVKTLNRLLTKDFLSTESSAGVARLRSGDERKTPEERRRLALEAAALQEKAFSIQARILENNQQLTSLESKRNKDTEKAIDSRYQSELEAAERIAAIEEQRYFNSLDLEKQLQLLIQRRDNLFARGDVQGRAEGMEIQLVIDKMQEEKLNNLVSDLIKDVYGAAPEMKKYEAQIPVNAYQRVGLSLGGSFGNMPLEESRKQTRLLESIDRKFPTGGAFPAVAV